MDLTKNVFNIADIVRPVASTISKEPWGILSGIDAVDKITFGHQLTELTILAGRSSMGKTAYGIDTILKTSEDEVTLYFSMELSKKIVIQRMLSNLSGIPLNKLKTNTLSSDEEKKFEQAVIDLENRKLFIDDSSLLTPQQCFLKIKELGNISFVVIDYLQLMVLGDGSSGNLTQDLDKLCQNLRATAKHFNIPILLLSQLSRKPDERPDHEPRLSDLRSSGGIEQTADVVLMLHRPSYYEMREVNIESPDNGEAYVLIAKNRNGATGKVPVVWFGETMSFKPVNWSF